MSSKVFDIIFSPISLIVGDKIGHAITGVFLIAAGIVTGNFALASMGLAMVASSFTPKPKANKESANRLSLSFVTTEPRKIVFGTTALSTDVRYQTFTGTNQEFFHQVICCAAHQVSAISEIWIDNEKAWTVGGGVLGRFSGYLTVTTKLVGVSGAGFAVDAVWGTSASLTGCAQIWLKYKTTGASKSTDSPFSGGISPRLTIRGSGALVYDPRLDSTVTGGSGSQRADDQTTWAFGSSGRNPALQLLWYLLGWQINGRISVGMGVPPARINLPSFITAANVCDETVALAAGGSESRYRSDGAFSEGDDRSVVISNLLASMAGTLRDNGGKIALTIFKNDLASPVAAFTEADILGEESWEQTAPLDKTFNVVRGHYIDASDNALYQPVDFPEVPLSGGSVDGIQRIDTVEYTNVQSAAQAQRLAKQRLQRTQYPGRYTAKFGPRAWQVSLGDPITLSHQGLGWSAKLFRVVGQSITPGGVTAMVLQEENAAIYAWAAEDSAPVVAGTPTVYDPQNAPFIAGVLVAGTTADWPSVTNTDPTRPRPADGATADLSLTALTADYAVVGNSITKTTASGWTTSAQVVSVERAVGVGVISFRAPATNTNVVVGFDTSSAARATPYSNMVGANFSGAGTGGTGYLQLWNGSANIGSGATWAANDQVQVIYDGTNVYVLINGVQVGGAGNVVAIGAGLTYYVKAAIYQQNLTLPPISLDRTVTPWAANVGDGLPENNADVTRAVSWAEAGGTVTLNADSGGTILSGQLPMTLPLPVVTKGGASIRTDNLTTYAIASSSFTAGYVTVDSTNGSSTKGQVTLTSSIPGAGGFNLVISYNGQQIASFHVDVKVQNAASGGGGGVGATLASFTVNDYLTATSYAQIGSTVTVTVAGGATIHGAFSDSYDTAGLNKTATPTVKWQYSPTGAGTWSDFAAGVAGYAANTDSEGTPSPGSITCNKPVTPASATYDVRLVAQKSGTGPIIFDDTTATVSVS